MNYTVLTLAGLGLFGILIHNLVKLNSLNREQKGEINIFKYWKIERFSIILSVCVVAVCLIVRSEVKQLESLGKWLGLAFVAIGYMAQSIVVSFSGRAQQFIEGKSSDTYTAQKDQEQQNK